MRTLPRLLVCIVCLASNLAAQSLHVDSTPVGRMVQDSTGQIWGAGYPMSHDLYRWENDTWRVVTVSGVPSNSRPVALAGGSDGAVYSLWTDGHGRDIVTWHQGPNSRKLAEFSGDLTRIPSLFVDPQKNVWITDRGIHINRVTPEGKAETAYTLDYEDRWDTNRPNNSYINFQSVFATADGQGRVWFWSGGPSGGGVGGIEGILIFDGNKFELHNDVLGLPIGSYPAVVPDDADHMWVAASRDRLYRVDTKTLTAEVVPEPAPNAFHFTQSIFQAGGATYVVAVNGLLPVADRTGEGRFGVLWRLQDGEWKRVINGLDMRPQTVMDPHRSFVPTPQGLWLGAYGTGPWFIPAGQGEPVHIDWRYGFSLAGSEGLQALPDGRLLMVAAATGSTVVKPAELLASAQSPADVRSLNPLRVLIPDRQNHLWGFLSGEKVISEWDGKSWTDHPLPEKVDPLNIWNFAMDSQDRIWVLTDRCHGDAFILNPHGGNVEDYPDFSAALQAQLPRRASFHIQGNRFTVPTFTPDGRIGFRDPCGQAHYFNGQDWQTWNSQDIDPTHRGIFDGPAFFDKAGNFAVNIAKKTWELTPAGEWRVTASEAGYGTDWERSNPHRPAPPPGCEIRNLESVVQDRLGTFWMTARGRLYRAVPGLCVPQFAPDQHQPFIDLRTIRTALIDPQGNAFLETYFRGPSDVGEYVIVDARQPQPQTRLHASVETTGIVQLHFETQLKDKVWYRWRVDGGDWTAPTPSAEATVDWLANGQHKFEAAALDERLQIDPTPAVAEVTLKVNSQEQIAAFIEQLHDADYSRRDAAVSALVRQAAAALPALKSAREKATPDQQWWIDAAIQQIEDKLAKSGKP
jgi:streptogramin lyase